jgi:hypothetical protein
MLKHFSGAVEGFSRRGFGVFRAKGARELSLGWSESGTLGIRINISAALKEQKKRT